jgi:hypothetical protein
MPKLHSLSNLLQTASDLLLDALRFARGILQPRAALAAENLFLRKQLALYLERQVKPQRARKAAKAGIGVTLQTFSVATSSNHRQAGDLRPLPSARISVVLEVEIEAPRTASHSYRTSEAHCNDG